MCGLFGFSSLTETTKRMAPFLAYAMQERGVDSWGATNGIEVVRELGPILATLTIPDGWERGIFHTRAASVGDVTIENAHPFTVTDNERTVIGIHNGHISNYTTLNTIHNRNVSVDSQHIFHHIHSNLPCNDIVGWGAVAWYDTDDPTHLQLVRFNMDDLHIAKLVSGEWVFASTRLAVVKAAMAARAEIEDFYKIDGDTRYRLSQSGGLVKGPRMVFGGRYTTTTHHHTNKLDAWMRNDPWENWGDDGTDGSVSDWRASAFNRRQESITAAFTPTTSGTGGAGGVGKFHPDQIDSTSRKEGLCAKCKLNSCNRRSTLVCDLCWARFLGELDEMDVTEHLVYIKGEWSTVADWLGVGDDAVDSDASVAEALTNVGVDDDAPWDEDESPLEALVTSGFVSVGGGLDI
jgi:hypothetical protein